MFFFFKICMCRIGWYLFTPLSMLLATTWRSHVMWRHIIFYLWNAAFDESLRGVQHVLRWRPLCVQSHQRHALRHGVVPVRMGALAVPPTPNIHPPISSNKKAVSNVIPTWKKQVANRGHCAGLSRGRGANILFEKFPQSNLIKMKEIRPPNVGSSILHNTEDKTVKPFLLGDLAFLTKNWPHDRMQILDP